MRKINKLLILSTSYKSWENNLEINTLNHPTYSSNFRFYLDVVTNLYYCQGGLCAYTEKRICESVDYEINKWSRGRYNSHKPKHFGELDHFDPSLKKDKGWLWENFFMIDGKINRLKLEEHINELLKPDREDYDPFEVFEYDYSNHVFIASTKKFSEIEQSEINESILALGINYVIGPRTRYLRERIQYIEDFAIETWESIQIDEYPTAFEFIKIEKLSL